MRRCIIVVPCYNEAERIEVDQFARFADQHRNIGFVMVNDGSHDATLSVLKRLEEVDDQAFRILDTRQNVGKAEAVRRGILLAVQADPDFVGYWDADLATPLEQIVDFVAKMNDEPDVTMIMGSRVRLLGYDIERQPIRHVLGRVFATAASLVLKLPVYDTQCGAKLFRAGPDTRRLFAQPFRSGWVFDVEILARLARIEASHGFASGQRVREFPLPCWKDVAGSKVRPSAFVRSFFQLARIAWTYRQGAVVPTPQVKSLQLPAAADGQPTRLPRSAALRRKSA